ncbi:FadR/GntR family transcriptional regulator [Paeniglutamicibacter sp. R2-26]|uniref:FadR/GntR family transcriptional regulator n=1 Tax=Paeniglutamicibacter sp. R2-26 TaxID=3144417 RepID=UPI003EE7F204
MRKTLTELFSPVVAAGVSEAIVRRIGELIGSGELRPGDRLPTETELATAFSVAPMTVRAALQALREHDMIETRRGRGGGTFVRADAVRAPYFLDAELPTLGEFEDFTIWRSAVSGEASARLARRFADGTITDTERLRLLELADASHAHGLSPETFRFADAELHLYIAELSGSTMLLEAERSIQWQLTRTLRHMVHPPNVDTLTGQSHAPLVLAIVGGDAEEARRQLSHHVQSTLDLMVGLHALRPN